AAAIPSSAVASDSTVVQRHSATIACYGATPCKTTNSTATNRRLIESQVGVHLKNAEVRYTAIAANRGAVAFNSDGTGDPRQPVTTIRASFVLDAGKGDGAVSRQDDGARAAARHAAAGGSVGIGGGDGIHQRTGAIHLNRGCKGRGLPQGQEQGQAGQRLPEP